MLPYFRRVCDIINIPLKIYLKGALVFMLSTHDMDLDSDTPNVLVPDNLTNIENVDDYKDLDINVAATTPVRIIKRRKIENPQQEEIIEIDGLNGSSNNYYCFIINYRSSNLKLKIQSIFL